MHFSMPVDLPKSSSAASWRSIRHHAYIAWYIAWSDTRARYKRSVIGPFWLVLSTLIGVGGLAVVWGALMNADMAVFVPSLAIGLVLWQIISGSVTESVRAFTDDAAIIKNIKTPPLRISLQLLFRQIINLLHNMVLVVLVLAVFPRLLSPTALFAIPGLILVLINLLWVIHVLGFLGARFRDLDPLVSAIMPMLFFMSPVLYRSHELGAHAFIMRFNPLSYFVEIVRDPLLGHRPDALTYGAVVIMAVVGWSLTLWMTHAKKHRLAYWV